MILNAAWSYRSYFPQNARRGLRQHIRVFLPFALVALCFYLLRGLTIVQYPYTTALLEEIYDPPSVNPEEHQPKILLVAAYFPLPKSKHSADDYNYWLREFLGPITTDIYFFTTPEHEEKIRDSRGHGLPIVIDTTYSTAFDVPPLKGFKENYTAMYNLDREKNIHNPELYAIWNAKPFLLEAGLKNMARHGKTYDYAFWNDAGSIRGRHVYKDWPDPARIERVWRMGEELTGVRKEDLLFFPLIGIHTRPFRRWEEDWGPVDTYLGVSEGSFFGGSPSTVSWWNRTFYAYHDYWLSLGHFVGVDQSVFDALFLLFPERIITNYYFEPDSPARQGRGIWPFSIFESDYLGVCGSQWFYYQFWLSSARSREETRKFWLDNWSWWERKYDSWKNNLGLREKSWWRAKESCRLTPVRSMRDLLRRQYGKNWSPPSRKLVVEKIDH